MNRSRLVGLACVAVAILAVAPAQAAQGTEPARRATSLADARDVVVSFFTAIDTRRYDDACSLLGERLRSETRGLPCPVFLRAGTPGPLRYRVLGARVVDRGVGVLVRLGQTELEHVRMRTWLAIVRTEDGALKIVATRLLR